MPKGLVLTAKAGFSLKLGIPLEPLSSTTLSGRFGTITREIGDRVDKDGSSCGWRGIIANVSSTMTVDITDCEMATSSLLVPPNLAMLTVDFSIRLAPSVRK